MFRIADGVEDSHQREQIVKMSEKEIRSSDFIRAITLSKMYTKVCEVASAANLPKLLLLSTVVAMVDYLAEPSIEMLLDRLIELV